MKIVQTLAAIKDVALQNLRRLRYRERELMLLGELCARDVHRIGEVRSLRDVEFQVFSQWGDDGIIQWLIHNLELPHRTFIEFGVSDYRESNTRFLLMHDNWSGFVMDGSRKNIKRIQAAEYYWRHALQAQQAFITCENINDLLSSSGFAPEVGILHIDIDGNDYWVWKSIEVIRPIIVIVEYNSVFGPERTITIPYQADFQRAVGHLSNLYFGASLGALVLLANQKGYAFIGSNSAGNNAYFVLRDRMGPTVREVSVAEGYVESKFRESRDREGALTFHTGDDRLRVLRGLPVINVASGMQETL